MDMVRRLAFRAGWFEHERLHPLCRLRRITFYDQFGTGDHVKLRQRWAALTFLARRSLESMQIEVDLLQSSMCFWSWQLPRLSHLTLSLGPRAMDAFDVSTVLSPRIFPALTHLILHYLPSEMSQAECGLPSHWEIPEFLETHPPGVTIRELHAQEDQALRKARELFYWSYSTSASLRPLPPPPVVVATDVVVEDVVPPPLFRRLFPIVDLSTMKTLSFIHVKHFPWLEIHPLTLTLPATDLALTLPGDVHTDTPYFKTSTPLTHVTSLILHLPRCVSWIELSSHFQVQGHPCGMEHVFPSLAHLTLTIESQVSQLIVLHALSALSCLHTLTCLNTKSDMDVSGRNWSCRTQRSPFRVQVTLGPQVPRPLWGSCPACVLCSNGAKCRDGTAKL